MLHGGNIAGVVVRVGMTVRKPVTSATPAVEALLGHLTAVGFAGAPRTLGVDGQGRHSVEFVLGRLADTLPALTGPELCRLGALVRALHDAAAEFVPPPAARWQVAIAPDREELVCHHDLAPWNLVRDGQRWVFIDWDGAGPGSRLWDSANVVATFVPLWGGGESAVCADRSRMLVDGYGLTVLERRELLPLLPARVRAMYDLLRRGADTGRQPWARLHAEGHGEHRRAATDFIEQHRALWAEALG